MHTITFRDLKPEEIEVRVGSTIKDKMENVVSFGLLLYKTARVDANILDETVGLFNWQKKFYQVKNTMICSIGLYDEERHEWVWKDDGGDDDYQMEKVKAECSDSFKRAGFSIGIGRKLYSASKIFMRVDRTETNTEKSYYQVSDIEYDDTSITKLEIINKKTKEVVISYGMKKAPRKTEESPTRQYTTEEENAPIREEERKWLTEYVNTLTPEQYNAFFEWLEKTFKTRKIAELTASQGIIVVEKLKRRK